MNKMNKDQMIQNARDHCFFIGINDSGAELCRINMVYGIAGIHYIQDQLGLKQDATFIATPDMTITRNASRWKSGFGYGGKISWGNGDRELVALNTKPNACGMLAGGLDEMPDIEVLIKRLHRMEMGKTQIDGIDVIWDFYKSNHFIDIFEVKPVVKMEANLGLAEYMLAVSWRRAGMKDECQPTIESVDIEHDGNMTLVTLITNDGKQYLGWSKFNPNDVLVTHQVNKKGNWYSRTQSRYNKEAGIRKAIKRAVDKILDS